MDKQAQLADPFAARRDIDQKERDALTLGVDAMSEAMAEDYQWQRQARGISKRGTYGVITDLIDRLTESYKESLHERLYAQYDADEGGL